MFDTAAATMTTAFGKRVTVQVIEFDSSDLGPIAYIFLPDGTRAVVKRSSLSFDAQPDPEPTRREDLTPGLYESDGSIYKVQVSKTSGKPYAKRLILIGGTRLMSDGEKAHLEYEYAPGAIKSLTPEMRMDLEAATRFGIEYGFCVRCGAFLKDATSVEVGIGPVCRKAFAA